MAHHRSPARRASVIAGLCCSTLMATALLAQQQTPTFRSGVDVVAIDVTVVDRSGTPIAGLTPADFTVLVDGQPRRVASAQFVDYSRRTGQPADVPGAPPPAPVASSATPPLPSDSRDVIIVIDEDTLEAEDGLVARRAALTFLANLSPAHRVGVNAIPRLRSNFTVTADRAITRKAIESWVPGASRDMRGQYWIGLAEAFEIDANDQTTKEKVVLRECGSGRQERVNLSSSCAREVVMEARQIASRKRTEGTLALNALRTLARGLQQIPGPKTIVLVSGGIHRPESMSSFHDVERDYAAAQITLYSLFFEKAEYHAGRTGISPSQGEDDRLLEDGLANVTSATGGTFLRVIGTAEPFFGRVATELSAAYLLGIEVAAGDRDGRPHRVDIKVNRQGLDVHGRKQYVIPVEKPPSRPQEK